MNNLVFNTTASDLKASMYGYNQSTATLQQIQLDSTGNMLVSGDVTITNDTLTVIGDVTITNETLTVQIAGQTFTSSTATLTDVTGTGNVFTATKYCFPYNGIYVY